MKAVAAATAFTSHPPSSAGQTDKQSGPATPTIRKPFEFPDSPSHQSPVHGEGEQQIRRRSLSSGIEPSADMMTMSESSINLSVPNSVGVVAEPTVDQNLQTAEEGFFETIDQVKSDKKRFFKILIY